MTILVTDNHHTFKARIITPDGRVAFTATCTSGPLHAAQAVVRIYYGKDVADTVSQLTDQKEIKKRTSNAYIASTRGYQKFTTYTATLNPPKS
jgi:hypothetical protein